MRTSDIKQPPRLSAAVSIVAVLAMVSGFVGGGCRFGGPTDAPAVVPADAGATDVTGVEDPDTRGGPARGPVDAPVENDPTADASDATLPADASGGNDGGVAACLPPFVSAVCDPVCNTGCPAASRCDVSDIPRTGACVGLWIGQEGDLCVRGATTDSCATNLSCVDGKCHRLCYRDSDCTRPGTCCALDIEAGGAASGFRACVPC